MAVCHKCGGTVTASDKKCPNCGAKVKRKKGAGGNAALLIIFLVVLLGFGGAIVYFMYRDSRPQLGTFDCNCDAFTGAVNRLLDGDENTTLHLDARKWKVDREHTVVIYDGGSFTLKVKTAKNNDISSKIRELRVGPTNTEDGVTMAALSISALEKGVSKDTALYDLGNVKALLRDKMSYDAVSFTFDREKDEFVLVPSSGNRSPEQLAATDDEASSLVVSNSVFVSGDRFIEAGGKYIFTNGDGIRFRDKITDNNTKFSDAKNDGQLLSDGTVVYYVTDTGKQRRVCSAKLDGSEEKTLFEVEGNVRLLHFTNKCLYYVTSSADKPRSFLFSKYRLDTKDFSQFDDIRFDPAKVIITGSVMYCTQSDSVSDAATAAVQEASAYEFNFNTEEFKEVLANCHVSPHGYINGVGNPCLDSHETDSTNSRYSNHYLYTVEDGKLKKSPEIKNVALLMLASPTTGQTVLYDNARALYYAFDRESGKLQQLALPSAGSFTYDIDHPEDIYFYTNDTNAANRRLSGVYKLVNGEAVACGFGPEEILLGANPVIADGYIVDVNFDAHPISSNSAAATATAGSA